MNIFVMLISERSNLVAEEISHHMLLPCLFNAFLFLDSINKLSSGCVSVVGIYVSVIMRLAYLPVSVFTYAILLLSVRPVIMHYTLVLYTVL